VEFVAKKRTAERPESGQSKQKLDNGTTRVQDDEESVASREQKAEISGAGAAEETSVSNRAWRRATARFLGASFVRTAHLVEKT
jgi:hypothetical protein